MTTMSKGKSKQPTGITDVKRLPLYERGSGEIVQGKAMGFKGVRTVDDRTIKWENLFYEKEDAVKSKQQ